MGFVNHDNDVSALGEHRVRFTLLRVELVNQGEDIAVVFTEQLPQVSTASCLCFILGYCPGGGEVLVDLPIQF